MTTFELHPQLAADTFEITRLPLCQVRLMNDANYLWLILVPQRAGLRELYELSEADQAQFMRESSQVARLLQNHFHAHKINIAALGNLVPQLHIHHIARYTHDPAWPAPVWGHVPAIRYSEAQASAILRDVAEMLEA